jgi:hypothetical protein
LIEEKESGADGSPRGVTNNKENVSRKEAKQVLKEGLRALKERASRQGQEREREKREDDERTEKAKMADKRAIMLSKNAKQLFLSSGAVFTNYFCVPELFVPRVLGYCTTDGHKQIAKSGSGLSPASASAS